MDLSVKLVLRMLSGIENCQNIPSWFPVWGWGQTLVHTVVWFSTCIYRNLSKVNKIRLCITSIKINLRFVWGWSFMGKVAWKLFLSVPVLRSLFSGFEKDVSVLTQEKFERRKSQIMLFAEDDILIWKYRLLRKVFSQIMGSKWY